MKTTLSVIKADIGSIGGHVAPSKRLLETVEAYIHNNGRGLVTDYNISHTGDDIAILMTHTQGVGNEAIHKLAWNAFRMGTDVAKEQGLYGAGQDLLKEAFSGNVKGMGPAVAEMEFEERANEPFLFFRSRQDRPWRLQSAPVPGVCRSDEHTWIAAVAEHIERLQIRHHGRQLHRRRPCDRTERAGRTL